jgi:hypothetical protein
MVMKLIGTANEVVIGYGGIVDGNPDDGRARLVVHGDGESILTILSKGREELGRDTLDYDERKFPIERFSALCHRLSDEHGPLFVEGVSSRAASRMLDAGLAREHTFEDGAG